MSVSLSRLTLLFFPDDYVVVMTKGMYKFSEFSMSVAHLTSVVFKVKSCRNAYVLLGTTFNNDHRVILTGTLYAIDSITAL